MCNGVAIALIRISPFPLLTVVVGVAAAAAWNRVGLQSSIADVLPALRKISAMMRIHQHLILLANAVTHYAIA